MALDDKKRIQRRYFIDLMSHAIAGLLAMYFWLNIHLEHGKPIDKQGNEEQLQQNPVIQ